MDGQKSYMCPVHVAGLPDNMAPSRYLGFLHKHNCYGGKAETASPSRTRLKSHTPSFPLAPWFKESVPPRNKEGEVDCTRQWESRTHDCRYLEISGKYHLPQTPAEGRSVCTVVRSPSEQPQKEGERVCFWKAPGLLTEWELIT